MFLAFKRFTEVPHIFKPVLIVLLFFLFIFYVCSSYSWWSWFCWVVEVIVVSALCVGIALDYDTQMFYLWHFSELIISGIFVCVGILNIILHISWLVKGHKALYGIEAIFVVLLTAIFALNGVMVRKLLKLSNSSTSPTYPPANNTVTGVNPATTNQYPPGVTYPPVQNPAYPPNTGSYPQPAPPPTNYNTQS